MPPLHLGSEVIMREARLSVSAGGRCIGSDDSVSSDAGITGSTTPSDAPSAYKRRGTQDPGPFPLNKVDRVGQNMQDQTDAVLLATPRTETTSLITGTFDACESRKGDTVNTAGIIAPSKASITTSGKIILQRWIYGMILPLGTIVWLLTGSGIAVIGALLFMPMLAIIQGAISIVRYRLKHRDCPLPKAPSHGIVRVQDSSADDVSSRMQNSTVDPSREEREGPEADNDTPLRLLVIGDSLAVGVGQSSSSTPLMPETIAKSLSKEMGGRPVLWTCHGAPGASAGWIVRELERSIKEGKFQQSSSSSFTNDDDDFEGSMTSLNFDLEEIHSRRIGRTVSESPSDSASEESADSNSDVGEERGTWQERLREERVHFDPNRVGPFDIAVVLTGSNDLKSAFFPFLLTGEDAKFRKEAQQRGGGYGKELTRILQVLNQGMRLRFQTLRDSVEEATQIVRERLGSVDNVSQEQESSSSVSHRHAANSQTSMHGMIEESTDELLPSSSSAPLFPMVVLPGLPARALPVFSVAPLRWLAVPIVDIMDSHKRRLARRHRGEVLFVDAPTPEQITEYMDEEGEYRRQEKQDNVLLRLRDIKTHRARQIESDMQDFFSSNQVQSKKPGQRNRHHDVFSVDGIHPNDVGYTFWGRHIAHHIVQEWQQKKTHGQDSYQGII